MAILNRKIRALAFLQLLIGIGAFLSGLSFVIDPTGVNLGFLIDWLERSVFSTYMIPGLIFMFILGFGNILGGIFTLKNNRKSGIIASFLGFYLMMWMITQLVIFPFHWAHLLYLLFGFAEVLLGVAVYLSNLSQHMSKKIPLM